MAIGSSSDVHLCGAEEGFTDVIGGEGDVEGKAGFKETGESTEGSASVCGKSACCGVNALFYRDQDMSLPLRKPRVEESLDLRRRPVEDLLAMGLLAAGWPGGEQQVVDSLALSLRTTLDRTA